MWKNKGNPGNKRIRKPQETGESKKQWEHWKPTKLWEIRENHLLPEWKRDMSYVEEIARKKLNRNVRKVYMVCTQASNLARTDLASYPAHS